VSGGAAPGASHPAHDGSRRRAQLATAGFRLPDGTTSRRLTLDGATADPEWAAKQAAALPHYESDVDRPPAAVEALYRAFENYIARFLYGRRGVAVLDVGCDPFAGAAERAYPFVHGRLEDLPDAIEPVFDVFLFATSLDHIRSLAAAAAAVRKLARPGAHAIFWVGLRDSALLGRTLGATHLQPLFADLAPVAFLGRWLKLAFFDLPRHYAYFYRQNRRLRHGRPLDRLHFHYFTNDTIDRSLRTFGDVIDRFAPPGGADLFATVRLPA
jgi:SAM-dependent methyltransferase